MIDVDEVLKRLLESDDLSTLHDELTEDEINTLLTRYHEPVEAFVRTNQEKLGCTNEAVWLIYDFMGKHEPDDVIPVCHEHLMDVVGPRTYYIDRVKFVELGETPLCGFVFDQQRLEIDDEEA